MIGLLRQDYLSHWMAHACLTTCADSDLLRQVKDWELAWVDNQCMPRELTTV